MQLLQVYNTGRKSGSNRGVHGGESEIISENMTPLMMPHSLDDGKVSIQVREDEKWHVMTDEPREEAKEEKEGRLNEISEMRRQVGSCKSGSLFAAMQTRLIHLDCLGVWGSVGSPSARRTRAERWVGVAVDGLDVRPCSRSLLSFWCGRCEWCGRCVYGVKGHG